MQCLQTGTGLLFFILPSCFKEVSRNLWRKVLTGRKRFLHVRFMDAIQASSVNQKIILVPWMKIFCLQMISKRPRMRAL